MVERLRNAPATCLYVLSLLVTSATLRAARPGVRTELLHELSTNLSNMEHQPIRVLILSAFWIDTVRVVPELVIFVLVSVPAENWLGTARWIIVFVLGHVGATVLTVAGIAIVTRDGHSDMHLLHTVDVGISYGLYAIAAVLIYHLSGRGRVLYVLALAVSLGIASFFDASFTDVGHVVAIGIGLACYPLTRSRPARQPAPS